MTIENSEEKDEEKPEEGHQLMHVGMTQGGELPDNWA
jgi:hypothetical protein